MKNIVKLVYDDGEEIVLDLKPMEEILPTDDDRAKFQKRNEYRRQFRMFQRQILDGLDQQIVEEYAKQWFDLIDEADAECDEPHLETCKDKDLIEEAQNRGLIAKYRENIMNENFAFRFAQIVERESPIEIESWLSGMESKLRLVV